MLLSLALAPVALAAPGGGGGGGGGGSGGGGGGGGGGAPPAEPAPQPAPQPAPEPAPTEAPGNSGNAPGHDPAGPGNSENAPGHDPDGPGNSEEAHAAQTMEHEEQEPAADATPADEGPRRGGPEAERGRPEDAGRARNETGRPEEAPGREREKGPSERALERRAGGDRDDGSPGRGRGRAEGVGAGVSSAPPPAALESTSLPPRAEERVGAVHVRRDEREVDVARGDVEVAASGVQDPSRAYLVIIHPNGTEEVLAAGSVEAPWNTTGYENGYYTVEVRERTSRGEVSVATARVLVENPRAEALATVAAVATGAVVSAGAGALAARGVDVLAMAKSAATRASGEALTAAAEEKLRARTAEVARVDWRRRSALLLLAAGALLAFFKVFADRDSLLLALPVAFLAAFVYTVGDYGAEWLIARSSGAEARFRIWAPGAISLAVSSLLFRAPFGYPGYVSETDIGHRVAAESMRQKAGLRAVAFMGVGLALTLPFLVLGSLWRWELAEYGIGLALMMAAAGVMPFSPMPGKDVWAWSKVAWAALAGVLMALYVLWQLALLPVGLLIAAGVVGGAAFAMGLRMLRPRPA